MRNAIAFQMPDSGGEPGLSKSIGDKWYEEDIENKGAVGAVGVVEAIMVTDDLPGLYHDMERLRVYVAGVVVFEAPMHFVECVQYPA